MEYNLLTQAFKKFIEDKDIIDLFDYDNNDQVINTTNMNETTLLLTDLIKEFLTENKINVDPIIVEFILTLGLNL